eukprot:TRINITY_DN111114_c0_g1_i1.p1 TRINITY_DN111114_c0_g1~~TRINITY_DN111114_c0_g1_i1.p1  ORF type:complete len:734 (+),score=277.69 TRINITY_DN111114_c0_g1_i1:60-2204(+)
MWFGPGGCRRPGAETAYMLRVFAVVVGLLAVGCDASALRKRHRQGAAKKEADGGSPSARLERLLADVEESVRKGGQDAELVFAQLYSYDHQLEASLEREVGMLNSTRARLESLQDSFRSKSTRSQQELERLTEALSQSRSTEDQYQASSRQAQEQFDGRLGQVKELTEDLHAVVNAEQNGVTSAAQVSQKNLEALREVLAANGELHSRFADVFSALAVGQKAAALSADTITPALAKRAIAALQDVGAHLHRRKTGLLLQLQAREHKLSKAMSKAAAKSTMASGARAEGERKAEELAFSLSFTASVLQEDETFLSKVQEHMKAKSDLVDQIRGARKGQLQTLEDLVDLLKGKFSAPTVEAASGPAAVADASQAPAEDAAEEEELKASEVPLAFLQKARRNKVVEPHQAVKFSNLQTEVESNIRHKQSNHNILLRVQAMLDHATPIDSGSVKDVVSKMRNVLHAVEGEEASSDDAQRRCKEQNFHAEQEDGKLRASLQLMATSQNHTSAAIVAARKNLDGIATKASVLNKTTNEFNQLVAQAGKTLEVQNHDRKMIMAAIVKAQEVAQRTTGRSAPAAGALLGQLLSLLQTHDKSQRSYQQQQEALEGDLRSYIQGYEQLLTERKLHYERTLSALELYMSELSSDASNRATALQDDAELKKEGSDLCESILAFYRKHSARRKSLGKALEAVLPKVPDIVMKDNDAAEAEEQIRDED